MTNFYFNLNQIQSNPDGEPTVNRQSRLMSLRGKKAEKEQLSRDCLSLASELPLTCPRPDSLSLVSRQSDLDQVRAVSAALSTRVWKYVAMIFAVLVLSIGQMWGTEYATSTFFQAVSKATTASITPTEANAGTGDFITKDCSEAFTITSGGSAVIGYYSTSNGTTAKTWEYSSSNGGLKSKDVKIWIVLYSSEQFVAGDSIVIANGNNSNSGAYTIVGAAANNTSDFHEVSAVVSPSTTTPAKNTNYYYILPNVFTSSNYLVIRNNNTGIYFGGIYAYHKAAPASSDSYDIHIGKNNADYTDESLTNTSGTTWSKTITLDAGSYYEFKVKKTPSAGDAVWYGNNGRIFGSVAAWDFNTSDDNCKLYTSVAGSYTFSWDASNNKLSVTYPAGEHPTKRVYMRGGESSWCGTANTKYFVHSWNSWGANEYDTQVQESTCDGYYADIIWYNDYFLFTRNSSAATAYNNNVWNYSQDLTYDSSKPLWTCTGYTDSKGNFTSSAYSPTTYTISYAAGSTTATGGAAISGSKANESKTCGVDFTLPSSAVFTATGYTQTGWTTSDGGAQTHALGGSYTDNAAQTFYPVWTVNNYDLTWNLAGGTTTSTGTGIGSGVSSNTTTSQAFGTALTAPTVTKTGYNFSAWSPSVASTMPAANTTYTAQWTAKTTTITIDANTANHGSTVPSPITATYGNALPSFTAATGASGYSLTGYFTAATSGTKVINADGSLVRNTTYATDESTPKWKSEAATLTLYAQYEAATPTVTATWPMVVNSAFSAVGTANNASITPSNATKAGTNIGDFNTLVDAEYTDYTGKMAKIPATGTIGSSGSVTDDHYIKYTITVASGYTFKPTGFSATVGRFATDNGYAQAVLKTGATTIKSTTASNPNRSGKSKAKTVYSASFNDASTYAAGTVIDLYIYLGGGMANGKSYGIVAVSITGEYAAAACSAPAAPTAFSAESITSTGATFSITDAGDAASYDIYYSTSGTAPNASTPATTTSTSKTKEVTGLTASTTYYAWVRSVCDDTHKSDWVALTGSSFETSAAAASQTALVANTLYEVPDMIPSGASLTSSDQFFAGLSANTKFELIGSASGSTTPKVNNKSDNDKTIDDITFDDGSMWFKGNASLTSNIPTTFGLSFIVPEGGGKLYLYFSGTSTNIKLAKSGEVGSKPSCPNGYGAVDVTAGTYYLYGTGTDAPYCFYGLKLVVCTTPATAFGNGAYTVGGSALDLSTLISGKQGSGAITYTVKNANGTGATIAGSSFTATSAGTATVTATQAADATYCEKVMDATITVSAAAGHTVTYNYNGATSGTTPTSETGTSVTLPNPTRTDYELDGWYTTAGEKVGVGSATYEPEADITLYARWQKACDAGAGSVATFNFNAGNSTGLTIETNGANATYSVVNSKTNNIPVLDSYFLASSFKNDASGIITITTDATYTDIDSIKLNSAATDNADPKIAIFTVSGETETKQQSAFALSSGSVKTWRATPYKKDLSSNKPDGRVRFKLTTGGSGKSAGLDNIQIFYGGGSGTCYHIYYHGNGATSGFVSDTTSYADDAKATVLGYNGSRYPLTKDGYDFQGWATSADGAVAYTAGEKITIDGADVHLYAKWATASTALVTWKMKTADNEAWETTTGTGTTDETNITSISTAHDEGDNKAKNSATAKTAMAEAEVSGTAAPNKSARFTFTIAGGKQVEINKFDCKVFNVASGSRTYKAQISDGAGNVYNSTNTVAVSAEATLTDASFVFGSGKILRGAVTIRIYAWGSGSDFRMGPDVKFYGTVEDYTCATPATPTISGVSEYVPGQTITLTASHDGENYDNLTTYTWYKGDTWDSKSKVQDAAMGESGYTLTIAATGNAGLYWCEAANGTCTAHSAAGYDVTVFPAYTITYHLDGGNLDGSEKTSYTQFDEDYTLPTPTKTGSVFAGWYGASDFSGLPTVVLGSGSVGNKEYWAKWGAAVTVSWTVTKVDDELYRGGGGYSVKAVINETDWSTGFMDELELTATEGVTLKNIEVSENGESKVQVTADFDISTELAADATSITFTLNVPADGTYGPKVDEHEEDLTSCGGGFDTDNSYVIGKSNSDATNISSSAALRAYKTASDWYSKGNTTFTDKTSTDGFTISAAEKSYYWQNNGTFTESSSSNCRLKTIKLAKSNGVTIRWTNDELSFSKVRFIGRNTAADDPTTFTVSNGTTEKTFTFEAGNSEIQTKEVTMDFVSGDTKGIVISGGTKEINILIELIPTSVGGVTPTLTWDDGDADIANDGVSKSTSNDDFVYTARQDKNSLGAITYSSSDVTVATVNSTTGQVHLVGAAGTATITATIAASGCFSSANVSYTITVTDDCDDEAGTITTEDLGCSGIKMTVTGHTAAAGVIYQWYKVGTPSDATVGTNQDNFTATEAGSYYVIVTNTGDRHCAKRSTNTITVEAKAAATVTKIVDSWYVKNGRRTPDIALVKTTNATGFTVTNGSSVVIWNSDSTVTTGFGGCGFHMDDNGIIYLNGTTDAGAATSGLTGGEDETLTITVSGCGSSASQAITIHKQAATTYKEIAFVADGGKGMRKDSITVGHGDGTELYEYLDSVTAAGNRLFKLSERNIYWTTDEKAIREEYSQFDAILITDDPSTNTVVKDKDDYKTKGYVNAFGTMVDVRPIFTMEAYVSALKNWGAKGIAGNPESPNPRQYEMRLECKDHEIYGAGLPTPEDGTNVWEEVVDGEIFRHVILVDSTLGIYNGVKYNKETKGNEKPALQGFTGEAAGSLLGLGRILEGTLQAAIERQEEPAARLLVMGINAKALQPTCALTDEGKTVIKNILVYLLKTNMEEVDDCSNYFTGKIDSDWSKAGNWSKSALPSSEAKVRILAPCVISGIQPHVLQVSIVNSGNSNIRNTARGSAVCDGTLTIEPDGALIADGKIRSAVAPHFAANDLMPTTPEMLTINTRSDAQAALIFNNEEGLTKATVNLYSLGRKEGTYQFQYFAVPMEYVDVNPAFYGSNILTYVWHENGGWERRGYYTGLSAFEGIGITKKDAGAKTYTMQGNLTSTADREIALTHESSGQNIVGNSWLAPINIASLRTALVDDANIVDKTVYIYCTGNDNADDNEDVDQGTTETAGQWLAIPIEAAKWEAWTGLKVIPAMQAFCIKANTETTLTLNYKDHVRSTADTQLNEKLRAPKRRTEAEVETEGIDLIRIRVADSKTHTDLYLFEGEPFSDEFDNGWEAEYMSCDGRSAKLYAETTIGQMAVAAQPEYEGTVLGFAPGKETEYTFTFSGPNKDYYLNDLKLRKSTLISEDESYFFTFEEGDTNRFYISKTRIDAPAITTGTENTGDGVKARKVIVNDKLYIILNGKVYSAEGMMVK